MRPTVCHRAIQQSHLCLPWACAAPEAPQAAAAHARGHEEHQQQATVQHQGRWTPPHSPHGLHAQQSEPLSLKSSELEIARLWKWWKSSTVSHKCEPFVRTASPPFWVDLSSMRSSTMLGRGVELGRSLNGHAALSSHASSHASVPTLALVPARSPLGGTRPCVVSRASTSKRRARSPSRGELLT